MPPPNSPALRVFDPNITLTSPAGSCVLKMLQAAQKLYEVELFASRTDLQGIPIHRIFTPLRPVFLQSVLFSIGSVIANLIWKGQGISIGTQGGFPFCRISYAHCCHRLFLTRYRSSIAGGLATRTARLLNLAWGAAMEAIALRRARLIVVPSAGLAKELINAYGGALAKKVRIISNPVDCDRFRPPVERKNHDAFTFAFCALGNFEWKGLRLVLGALSNVPVAHLIVIGGTAEEIAEFQGVASLLGLTQRVRFVGLQQDIRPYLWSSDAFVFPSVYETFPLVCLQAAAAGLPLITTDLYGLEELLEAGVTGWRVDRNVASVSAAMSAAVADTETTVALGRAARERAQKYDTAIFQEQWLELLSAIQSDSV